MKINDFINTATLDLSAHEKHDAITFARNVISNLVLPNCTDDERKRILKNDLSIYSIPSRFFKGV